MSDLISREKLLNEINLLKKSPWYNKDFAAAKIVRKDAVTAVEMCIREAPGVTEWVSVKDRLPEKSGNYLVYGYWGSGKAAIDTADFSVHQGYFSLWDFTVKYWMPLPELPKE